MNFINNNQLILFIGVLMEENRDRNFLRIERKRLRDEMNPFEMPDMQFIQMFRLTKQSIINLINDLVPYMRNRNNSAISAAQRVLVALHFLTVGSFQNSIGSNTWLSVSQPTVSRIIKEICSLIAEHFLHIWVKFPIRNEEKLAVKQEFFRKYEFRGVLGAIDGTHVEIIAPPSTDVNHPLFAYINRKGKHSINVMLVSDANAKILACNARFPSSVHDAAVWQVSAIRNHLQEKYEQGDTSSHLIGDSGYPLEPWLFTPFLNPRDPQEEAFNNILTSSRNVIERTNGILKGRFRCLSRHRTLIYHPLHAANIIYTCCVLHNIAKHNNLDEAYIELPEENQPNDVTPSEEEYCVGELLLFHLQMLQFNAHEIYETRNATEHRFKGSKQVYIGVAVYPTVALFNHDCYPAVMRYFVGKNIVIKAIRPLQPQEVVAENYGPIFTRMCLKERQRSLLSRYWFTCQCQACSFNWPALTGLEDYSRRVRCATEDCSNYFTLPVSNDNLKCPKCEKTISLSEHIQKLEWCENQYKIGIETMHSNQPENAITILCSALDTFHRISCPPHRSTHLAQEVLQLCSADSGNVYQTLVKK